MNAAKQPVSTPSARNDRLYGVLLGPVVSEKSTMIGEKHEQVAFRVKHDATKTDRTAVQGAGRPRVDPESKRQAKALRPL